MSPLLKYVWGVKVCLTGWSAYKACVGDSSNILICGMSVSYFFILLLATLCSWKVLPKTVQIDALEGEYLRRLEEGLREETNIKRS